MSDAPVEFAASDRVETLLGAQLLKKSVKFGERYYCVEADQIERVLTKLKHSGGFTYFVECVGIDYSTWTHERDFDQRFEVVYNLFDPKTRERIFVKVAVNEGRSLPTAKGVFGGAEYPEREIQDLFGIPFAGNEPVEGMRFLLPDDWVGFPLRKEYPLGGEDVLFDSGTRGPAVEDKMKPHAGESFEGKTGSQDVSGR